MELNRSQISVRRIITNDLKLRFYKIVVEPLLSDDPKIKWKTFADWIRTNIRKEEAVKILFSDEKFFDIDGVRNSQNDRVWAVARSDINDNGDFKQRQKFPQEIMV